MVELHHIFVLLYASAAVLALAVGSVAWLRRAARGALWLAVLLLGIAVWSGTAAVMWSSPALVQQVFWLQASALGLWMVPVAVLMIALDIAHMDRWRTPGFIAVISITSFALANIEWLNPGRLYDTAFVAEAFGPYTHYRAVPGPLYWAFSVYAFAMMGAGLVIIFRAYLRSSGVERTQAGILALGGLLPFAAGIVTESRSVLVGLDLAPLAFLITGALWLFAPGEQRVGMWERS